MPRRPQKQFFSGVDAQISRTIIGKRLFKRKFLENLRLKTDIEMKNHAAEALKSMIFQRSRRKFQERLYGTAILMKNRRKIDTKN